MDVSELLERYSKGERDFSHVSLAGQYLSGINLIGANLSGINLIGANLSEANLSRTNLGKAYLVQANLRKTNLSYANLIAANLMGAKLTQANLIGAILQNAYLGFANLSEADLSAANLRKTNLSKANLSWTDFTQSNLENSNLKDTNLERANLAYAYLKNTDLTNANLTDANLAGADLTGAILKGTILKGTILDPSLQNQPSIALEFLLTSQQTDFIERLKSNNLLCSNLEGYHSELTIISGEELDKLREYCWNMVDKSKKRFPNSESKTIFKNHLKGKLGEVVVKKRLAALVSDIDYDIYHGGDGGIDLKLTEFPDVGIQIKSRTASYENIRWQFKRTEIEKNKVLVCVLIAEEVSEAQSEYHLILGGFLPTAIVKPENDTISFKIQDLWYGGGLKSYLQLLTSI